MPYSNPEDKAARLRQQRRGSAHLSVGSASLRLLREMAAEDGISVSEEIRRLVHREHFTRVMARKQAD